MARQVRVVGVLDQHCAQRLPVWDPSFVPELQDTSFVERALGDRHL